MFNIILIIVDGIQQALYISRFKISRFRNQGLIAKSCGKFESFLHLQADRLDHHRSMGAASRHESPGSEIKASKVLMMIEEARISAFALLP